MLRHFSFLSFFSFFVGYGSWWDIATPLCCEINEKYEKSLSAAESFLSVISFNSFVSLSTLGRNKAGYEPHIPGAIRGSQATRCGHTLRGAPCRSLASGCAPSNPAKTKRQKP